MVSETVVNVADDLSEVQARDLEAHFCMKKDYTVLQEKHNTTHMVRAVRGDTRCSKSVQKQQR